MAGGDIAIRVENLSKRYFVGHQSARTERYQTLRESLARGMKTFGRRTLMARGQTVQGDEIEEFWALKDVSFEVKRGEVIGVIGHNGAGKSTLLKILSRITEPTRGRVTIRGRVASLLEVGTGFHPELSGRENIFLNGAILGMARREVKAKFDEIVDFAEVEKFLDTPVKRYSSGMYMRLAFAVAAHLEPEILVVDEVLSVGDAAFQKKCLGKMKQVSGGEGRTVLFVSHQMPAIQNLCDSVIVMNQGKIVFQGNTESGVAAYLSSFREETAGALRLRLDREGSGRLRFSAVKLRGRDGAARDAFICGEPAVLELHFERQGPENIRSVVIGVRIDDELGQRVMLLYSDTVNQNFSTLPPDADVIEIEMPKLPLKPGRYAYTLHAMADGAIADWVKNAGTFDVEAGDFYGTGKLPPPEQGSFLADYSFRLSSRAG